MKNKYLLILEITWIAVGILCLAAAVKFIIKTDTTKTLVSSLMAIVSFAFAWIRHSQRKKR
jgi:hypothetical protein